MALSFTSSESGTGGAERSAGAFGTTDAAAKPCAASSPSYLDLCESDLGTCKPDEKGNSYKSAKRSSSISSGSVMLVEFEQSLFT